jgi:hypothetical protein
MIDMIQQPVAGFRAMNDQQGGELIERHVFLAFNCLPVIFGNNYKIHGL